MNKHVYLLKHSICESRFLFIASFLLLFSFTAPANTGFEVTGKHQQTQKRITGVIQDQEGQPVPHAYIVVKGATGGTVSDESGKYELTVNGDVTLVFSYVGYTSIELSTKGKSVINVVLPETSLELAEVVVVGYNRVERRHLASAIESVDMEKMKSRPVFKLQEGFAGTVPGVTVGQTSNVPGDAASLSIRGLSTLQKTAPLVIVDGIEQSMTDIDPNQIKSISVLKDAASASMYGSRGANGVIVIETERGATGDFKVLLNAWSAFQRPIDLPDFVNAADYMKLNNEARQMQGQNLLFTNDQIAAAERGEGTSTDWLKRVMPKKAHSYNINANISGGGGVGTFNLMLGYIREMGLNKGVGTEKYSARFNTNVNFAENFILLADFYAHRLQVDRLQANSDGHGLYQNAWKMNPTQPVYYDKREGIDIDRHYVLYNNLNPVASMLEGGTRNNLHDRITVNLRPRYYIFNGFHLAGDASYMINKSANKHERQTFKFYDGNGKPVAVWAHDVAAEQGVSESQLTGRITANYENDLRGGKDKLYAVIGAEVMNLTYTDYREIAKASFFGKLNYSFDNRYLLEVTFRRDGSSKFAPGNQWGAFPSVSLGWNIHNEKMFARLKEKRMINNLKLRLSYGKIGNENVDPYLWQEIVNTWGWTMRVPNPLFTWEKQRQWNAGLDLTALKNRLSLTFDIYNKFSYDLIYSDFPVPPLTGSYYLTSAVNIGEVRNKGWELSLKWNDKAGEVYYGFGGMLFDNKNKVEKAGYSKEDVLIFKDNADKIWYRGVPIDNYYGYQTDGYFQSREEIENTPAKLPNTLPGDIRYTDRNKDGVINDEDKVIIGTPLPRYNYSVNLDLAFKRWDLYILGAGIGKRDGVLKGLEGYPVLMDGSSNSLGAPRKEYAKNRWTPETPDSRFPRVWTGSSTNAYLSDVWLSDASYFRIQSLQVGYTFPRVTKGISSLRLYVNAQDFLTFTRWEGLEPERNNGGSGNYPRMATYSIGIKVTLF
ncbi:MAG: TonB-dependent receptor [Tannerella sp.]|jgi:TonB-linked SusC/RagA family outer membrane protein|nr:TonB-dependent receptor [Tannerella sp.]